MNIFKCKKCEEMVKCHECGHYVDKNDCQEVKLCQNIFYDSNVYFCKEHNKKYDRIEIIDDFYSNRMCKENFYKQMEVDNEGNPIGYKKVK